MNKFFISAILVSSMSVAIHPMNIFTTYQEYSKEVANKLDVPSFLALTLTCKQLKKVLDAIPVKDLTAITFVHTVSFGNSNLINRFIAEYDQWMFEPLIQIQPADEKQISVFTCLFGKQLQDFVGTYPVYCINKDETSCHYCLAMHDGYDNTHNTVIFFLNNDVRSELTSETLIKYLIEDNFDLRNAMRCMECYGSDHYYFSFRDNAFYSACAKDHVENEPIAQTDLKSFGLIFVFLMATRKNCAPLIKALLNNKDTLAILSNQTLHRGTLITNNSDIRTMINDTLKLRKHSLQLYEPKDL